MSKKKHSEKKENKPSSENVNVPAEQEIKTVAEKTTKKATATVAKNTKKAKKKKKLTLPKLLLGIVLLLVIPYAYLMLCGLVFDMWLKMYDMVLFIFYSLITFYIINIGIIIYLVIKYFRDGKK